MPKKSGESYEVSYGSAWVPTTKRLMEAYLREAGIDRRKAHKVLRAGATVSTDRGMTYRRVLPSKQ